MRETILRRSGLGSRSIVSNEGMKRALTIFIALSMMGSILTIISTDVYSHSGDVIFSDWAFSQPTMDGMINAGEWDDAVMLDLSIIPGTTMETYLYVMNDGTNLYMAYDAVGDEFSDMMDGAIFCFDTDHNGFETDMEDDQFIIGDIFGITGGQNQARYVYDILMPGWVEESCPFTEPGLDGDYGFSSSPNSANDHRMYEITIPLALLSVAPGDTIGFASHGFMGEGVLDFMMWTRAGWPACQFAPQPLSEYGDIILDTPPDLVGMRLTPDLDENFGLPGTDVDYLMTVKNKGTSGADTFELDFTSAPLGWAVTFYDETGTVPLTDTNAIPTPDTGPINTGDSMNFIARVTVPGGALPGDWDIADMNASSFNDPSVYEISELNTTVAFDILVVDDDAGLDSELWYTSSLTSLGYSFDVWNVSAEGSPDMNSLDTHLAVIWFTGNDQWDQATLNKGNRAVLEEYLDNGGKLYMSSTGLGQDAYNWNGFDDWYETYFDMTQESTAGGANTVFSQPTNPVTNGMAPMETHIGDYCTGLNGQISTHEPIMLADPAFNITLAGVNDTAMSLEHYAYRLFYTGFDFADVNNSVVRDDLMDRILNWLLPVDGVSIYPHQMGYNVPGIEVNYTLTVKNIGSSIDSFNLAGIGDPLWPIAIYDETNTFIIANTGPIDPYDSVDITVRVTVNPAAVPGDMDISLITATSTNDGTQALTMPLETQVYGDILLVDDDKHLDTELWYVNSLVANGYTYNIWNRTLYGVPTLDLLQDHTAVLWFTGNSDGNGWGEGDTLNTDDRALLENYLDGGGRFYLSSQYAAQEAQWGPEPWASWHEEFLDSTMDMNWWGENDQIGQLGNPIGDGLNIQTYNLTGDQCRWLDNQTSTFNVLAPAEPCFDIQASPGEWTMLNADEGTYRLVYSGFDFSGVNDSVDRDLLMWRILNWLMPVDGVSIYEEQDGYGYGGDTVDYTLTIRNIGSNMDTFDLQNIGGFHGWTTEFWDDTNTIQLIDTNGDFYGRPDTGTIMPAGIAPGDTMNITVRVYIDPLALVGNEDSHWIMTNSTNDPTINDLTIVRATVPYDAPWSDDMEIAPALGMAYWDPEGLWHQVDSASPFPEWNSFDSSWWYGQDATGDHETGGQNFGMLASPPIDLTGASFAGLGFMDWYDGDTWWNARQIKISVDGGDWQTIDTMDNMATPLRAWTHHSVNLDAYIGHVVKIGFWFDLGQFGWGGMNAPNGWYIDDIVIDITPPEPPTNTTASLSETGYIAGSDWGFFGPVINDYTATHASDDFDNSQGEWDSYQGNSVPQNEPVVADGNLMGGTYVEVQTAADGGATQRWQEQLVAEGEIVVAQAEPTINSGLLLDGTYTDTQLADGLDQDWEEETLGLVETVEPTSEPTITSGILVEGTFVDVQAPDGLEEKWTEETVNVKETVVTLAEPAITYGVVNSGTFADTQTIDGTSEVWTETNYQASKWGLEIDYSLTFATVPAGTFDISILANYTDADAADQVSIWLYDWTVPIWVDTGVDVFKGSPETLINLPGMANNYVSPTGEVQIRYADDARANGEAMGFLSIDYQNISVDSSYEGLDLYYECTFTAVPAGTIDIAILANYTDADAADQISIWLYDWVATGWVDSGLDVFKGSPATLTNLPGMSNNYVGPGGEVQIRLLDDLQGTGENVGFLCIDHISASVDEATAAMDLYYEMTFAGTPAATFDIAVLANYTDADAGDQISIWLYDWTLPGFIDSGQDVFKGSPATLTNLIGLPSPLYVGPGGEIWIEYQDDATSVGEDVGVLRIDHQEASYSENVRSLDLYYNCTFPQEVYGVFDIQLRGAWYFDTLDPLDNINILVYNFTSKAFDDTGVNVNKDSMAYRYVYNLAAEHYMNASTYEVFIGFKDDYQAVGEDTGQLYIDYLNVRTYTSAGWHAWQFDVFDSPDLETWTFNVEASSSANTENEGWLFEYSFDNIVYSPFATNIEFLATDTVDIIKSSDIPITGSGNVYIRATDTDKGWGNESSDYINVDHMTIVPTSAIGVRMGNVDVSWEASVSPDVASYNIYRATSIGGTYLQIAEGVIGLNYIDIDAGDQDWNDYFYYVRAVDSSGIEDSAISPDRAVKYVRAVDDGWNFVSFPVEVSDTSLLTVLQTLDWNYVLCYNTSDPDKWSTNNIVRPDFMDDLWALDHTRGMWLNTTGNDNMIVAGSVRTSTTITLKAGWNLVGYTSFNTSTTMSDALFGLPVDLVERFDAPSPYMMIPMLGTDIMMPGEAYWVSVSADCVWTVDW